MKKVLFISYMFPPIAGSGIQRPLKFVKYLPEFGIEPIVFCPQHAVWRANDPESAEYVFLRWTKIYRCGIDRLKRYFNLRFKRNCRRHPYFYYIALKYIWFIDFQSAWYFECRKEVTRIAQRENVDCVLTTSPPHSTHMFGQHLKKKLNLPWVMDLRDAMFDDATNRKAAVDCFRPLIHYMYEKSFYSLADRIVTVSENILDTMSQRHPDLKLRGKTSIITNGFDEDDFAGLKPMRREKGSLQIIYTGSFMGKQTPFYFLEALQMLFRRGAISPSDVLIRFIGFFSQRIRILMKRYAEEIPIEIHGLKSYQTSLRYQKSADLLLLIVSIDENEGGSQIYTGKVFEYIGAQRSIFAIIPDGPLKKLIERGRFGVTAPPKNINAIAEKLKHIILHWKERGSLPYNPNMGLRSQFSRRKLTADLASNIYGML